MLQAAFPLRITQYPPRVTPGPRLLVVFWLVFDWCFWILVCWCLVGVLDSFNGSDWVQCGWYNPDPSTELSPVAENGREGPHRTFPPQLEIHSPGVRCRSEKTVPGNGTRRSILHVCTSAAQQAAIICSPFSWLAAGLTNGDQATREF